MGILGVDPGREKCGLALVDNQGTPIIHEVVPSGQVMETVQDWASRFSIETVVMGDRTSSKQWLAQWTEQLGNIDNLPAPKLIDEHNSTLEARSVYWELYPPRGLKRLIPEGMRLPPRAIDDLAAVVLARRYLAQSGTSL
ncbi:MAG: resolvase [Cyanobacteria bacterium P01_D01_bin.73]